jgi:hypothetical protein
MNDKVTVLHPDRASEPLGPSEDCIKKLEALLARARAGELQGFAVASVLCNGLMESAWAGDVAVSNTAAAIAMLQYRFMSAWHGSPT